MNSRSKYLEDESHRTGCRFGRRVQLRVKDIWENQEWYLKYKNYDQH